jgi:hypothetical protein
VSVGGPIIRQQNVLLSLFDKQFERQRNTARPLFSQTARETESSDTGKGGEMETH